MDRVRRRNTVRVRLFLAFGWELLVLTLVEIGERFHYCGAASWIAYLVEEAASHDLEALFSARRPPGSSYATDNVLESFKRFAATFATDLDLRNLHFAAVMRLCGFRC